MSDVADVSEVHASSIFRVEVSETFIIVFKLFFSWLNYILSQLKPATPSYLTYLRVLSILIILGILVYA
jgi:uncharacterized protein involved in cysteine biosynthesis